MDDRRRAFIVDHTALVSPPGLPEIRLHLATEVTPLWTATAADLDAADLEPPYWAFAWAGGVAMARYILDHPEIVAGARVLDLGAGSGLVGIAARLAGAREVIAADIDPMATVACALNAEANGTLLEATARDHLDDDEAPELVVIGDLFYDANIAPRVARAAERWAKNGSRVWVGDPGRGYLPREKLDEVHTRSMPTSIDLESAASKNVTVYRVRSSAK